MPSEYGTHTTAIPVILCIATLLTTSGIPDEPGAPPRESERYEFATDTWVEYAAGIVAGETVVGCTDCDLFVACTMVRDVAMGGYCPYCLHPGRWHGKKTPRDEHREAVWQAVQPGGCRDVPVCRYLGSERDYRGWRSGLARGVQSYIIGNERGAIVCVP